MDIRNTGFLCGVPLKHAITKNLPVQERNMQFSAIANSFSGGGGLWALGSGVLLTFCYMLIGLFGVKSKIFIARDENVSARESRLVDHMESELSRLQATVSDIDVAMKAQEQRYTKAMATQEHRHATALENERSECSKEIQELYYDIDDLKSRVFAEEHRK